MIEDLSVRVKRFFLCLPLLLAGAAHAGEAFVSVEEVRERLDAGDPHLVLLHVGHGDAGYRRGHLPGAFYAGHTVAMTDEPNRTSGLAGDEPVLGLVRRLGVTKDSEVVLYGDANGVFPAPLRLLLDRLGVRARLLDGHLRGWADAGGELTTEEPPTPTPSAFEPPPAGERRVVRATLEEAQEEGVALVDVRTERFFRGEKPGHSVQRPGHVPGAVNLPWTDAFAGNSPPVLADLGPLKDRLAAAGVEPGDRVIVYDGIGTHAALGEALLTEMGFEDVRVLEAGYVGWDEAGLPVEAD